MIVIINNVDLLVFVKHTNCVFRAVVTFKHYSDILHPLVRESFRISHIHCWLSLFFKRRGTVLAAGKKEKKKKKKPLRLLPPGSDSNRILSGFGAGLTLLYRDKLSK
jgi:hypothetical protein